MYTGFRLLLADRFVHAACFLTCKTQLARGAMCVCCSWLALCTKNQLWFSSRLFDSLMLFCYHFHESAPLVNEAVWASCFKFLILFNLLVLLMSKGETPGGKVSSHRGKDAASWSNASLSYSLNCCLDLWVHYCLRCIWIFSAKLREMLAWKPSCQQDQQSRLCSLFGSAPKPFYQTSGSNHPT